MLSQLRIGLTIVVLTFLSSACGSSAAQTDFPSEQKQIIDTIQTVFDSMRIEDAAKLDSVTTEDFYVFDGGSRFSGKALLDLIKVQHATGKRYEWNVTEPDVHISGDAAWIAYVNKGSISDGSGTVSQQWLESAFLQKQGAVWKVVFMHSTRVPNSHQQNLSQSH